MGTVMPIYKGKGFTAKLRKLLMQDEWTNMIFCDL